MVEPSAEDLSAVLTDLNLPCSSWEEGPALADYLDRICAPLVGKVPYSRRMELRRELAYHVLALAEAQEELGTPPEEALELALQQFGTPEQVGRQWLSTWSQGTPTPPAAHAVSLGCFLLSSCLGCMLQIRLATEVGFTPAEALLVGPILPALAGLALCQAHRTRPQFTRVGLAAVPLIGALAASRISARPDVAPQAMMLPIAVTWGILGAATAGIAISAAAWLKGRSTLHTVR